MFTSRYRLLIITRPSNTHRQHLAQASGNARPTSVYHKCGLCVYIRPNSFVKSKMPPTQFTLPLTKPCTEPHYHGTSCHKMLTYRVNDTPVHHRANGGHRFVLTHTHTLTHTRSLGQGAITARYWPSTTQQHWAAILPQLIIVLCVPMCWCG